MVAELNAKIPVEPKTINLRSDDFDIRLFIISFPISLSLRKLS